MKKQERDKERRDRHFLNKFGVSQPPTAAEFEQAHFGHRVNLEEEEEQELTQQQEEEGLEAEPTPAVATEEEEKEEEQPPAPLALDEYLQLMASSG